MPITTRNALFVFVGGAVGTAMRWIVGEGADSLGFGVLIPLVIVNVVGSFLLGWFVTGERTGVHHVNALFAVGMLGSFTTFSSFAVASVELADSGAFVGGAAFALGSVCLGFGAAVVGRLVAEQP